MSGPSELAGPLGPPGYGGSNADTAGTDAPVAPSTRNVRRRSEGAGVDSAGQPYHSTFQGQRYHAPLQEQRNAAEEQETWQSFLRRAAPRDIALRETEDPVRRGFVEDRQRQFADEAARHRRRAATAYTTSSGRHASGLDQRTTGAIAPSQVQRRRPVSLQIQDRPLPQLPESARELPSLPGEHIVPRWQRDEDVSSCPICGRDFGIFFRRHHCRKCGRVVCASCSPHRITIPRQFIVNPPADGQDPAPRRTYPDPGAAGSISSAANPALGGGQEVRLCNPCVPDPNPLPPPSYMSADAQHFASYTRTDSLPSSSANRSRAHRASMPPQPSARALALHSEHASSPSIASAQRPPQWDEAQRGVRSPFGSAPSQSRAAHWPSASMFHDPPPSSVLVSISPAQSSSRHQIREEDECPVCHAELPPKGPDGSEHDREAHVVMCIQSHFSSSAPRSRPPPATAIAAAVAASAATPAQAGSSVPVEVGSADEGAGMFPASPTTRRRAPGMLVYHASEKDCVGEDGLAQECVICFEDFAVGAEMGRLECLCKFHRVCIRQWWDTKAIGACPVHQDGI